MPDSLTLNSRGEKNHAHSKHPAPQSASIWWDNCSHRVRGGHPFIGLNLWLLFGSLTLYLVNQFLLKSLSDNLIIQSYLNDFLAMGVLLPYANLMLALYPGKDIRLLSSLSILLFTLCVALFWEYATPMYLARSVGDYWDIVAYGAGGLTIVMLYRRRAILLPISDSPVLR